jgi:hypothetical protein
VTVLTLVTITPHDGAERSESTPIKFGFDRLQAGENMAPISPGAITASTLTNRTRMPVEISDGGSDCLVRSKGPVEDRGEGNTVRDV